MHEATIENLREKSKEKEQEIDRIFKLLVEKNHFIYELIDSQNTKNNEIQQQNKKIEDQDRKLKQILQKLKMTEYDVLQLKLQNISLNSQHNDLLHDYEIEKQLIEDARAKITKLTKERDNTGKQLQKTLKENETQKSQFDEMIQRLTHEKQGIEAKSKEHIEYLENKMSKIKTEFDSEKQRMDRLFTVQEEIIKDKQKLIVENNALNQKISQDAEKAKLVLEERLHELEKQNKETEEKYEKKILQKNEKVLEIAKKNKEISEQAEKAKFAIQQNLAKAKRKTKKYNKNL